MDAGQSLSAITAVDPAHLAAPEFLLALALLTLGIQRQPRANGGDVIEFRENLGGKPQRRFVFAFEPQGVDGVDTETWIKRWSDPEWMAANIQHPFRWMKELGANLALFAGWMKDHDPVFVYRGTATTGAGERRERIAYIPASLLGTPKGDEILRRAGLAA